jgi:geranylgeranyl diphosphate synthase, type II
VNVENYFAQRRRMIEEALDSYFPADRHQPASLHRALRYSLLSGGKRIRPLLTLAAAEAVGGRPAALLPFACAVEMIHTYSLIHDDLPAMDDDRLRRGQPTSHIVFGEGMAILAGDALLTDAFRLMADAKHAKGLSPKRVLQVIHLVGEAAGALGMVGGQAADLESEGKDVDLAVVEFIHVRKTGALLLAAVRVGAILAEASPSALRSLSKYGEYLGLCFQIVDDVMDAEGETAQTGKESGGDERNRKVTYATVLGVSAAKQRAIELRDDALAALERFGKRAEPLREIARSVVARMT